MPEHYRFRGSIQPRAELKRPVRAQLTGETDGTTAKLYLYDVIDSWGGEWGISAREFTQALTEAGDVESIALHINSPGGECYEGIAIMNQLRRHPAKVTAVVDGLAASAASFIAAGVDEVVMAPNSEMMIHDAWGIALGPASEMREAAERLDRISNNIAGVYAERPDSPADADAWRQLMLAETWFSAQEAVTAGLADRVEGSEESEPEPQLIDAFDLGVFRYQGRAAAPVPALDAAGGEPDTDDSVERERRRRRNANRLNLAHKRARVTASR
jgi:ATP-dependent protease ClpP protease subunit